MYLTTVNNRNFMKDYMYPISKKSWTNNELEKALELLAPSTTTSPWTLEEDGSYKTSIDLPGVPPSTISITTSDGVVKVTGTRGNTNITRTLSTYRNMDLSTATATLEHGVLTIQVLAKTSVDTQIPLTVK